MEELTREELQARYHLDGFGSGFAVVQDRATGERGSFEFRISNLKNDEGDYYRLYYNFAPIG
jgi:hypothetical protein